jgi:hypothetical protein
VSDYDPKSALKRFTEAGGLKGRPVGKRVGPAYDIKARSPFLCFPLMAWLDKNDALPQDIKDLPTSSKALKEHVRPDGGVYLGAFELPDDSGSTVIVFGEATTRHEDAKNASILFRQKLARIALDRVQQSEPEIIS